MAVIAGIVVAGAICGLAVLVGSALLRMFQPRLEGAAAFVVSAQLGLGCVSSAIFLLGMGGMFSSVPVLLLLGLAGGGAAVAHGRAGWTWPRGCCGGGAGLLPVVAVLAVPALPAFSAALGPEVRGDSIIYHISAALLFVVNRGHVEIPTSALTYIPQHQHLLYALGLLLQGDTAARLVHWFNGIVLLAGVVALARQAGVGLRESLLAAGLLVLCPVWIYLATSTYVDLAVAAYLMGALIVIVENRRGEMSGYLLAGLLTGFAMSCKYTAIVVGALPLGLVVLGDLALRRRGARRVVMAALVYGIAALAAFAPWLARNFWWTGNPLAPSLMGLLGPEGVPESTLTWPDIQSGDAGMFLRPWEVAAAVVRMVLSFADYGNFLFLGALVFAAVAVAMPGGVWRAFPRPVVMLCAFVAIALVVGVPLGAVRRDARYIMAHVGCLAVCCVLWGGIIADEARNARRVRAVAGVLVALLFVSWAVRTRVLFADLKEPVFPPISSEARRAFLAARLDNFERNEAISGQLDPAEGRILGAGYPARANYVLTGKPLTADLIVQRTDLLTPEMLPGLRRHGITMLFGEVKPVVAAVCERMGDYGGVPLWRLP